MIVLRRCIWKTKRKELISLLQTVDPISAVAGGEGFFKGLFRIFHLLILNNVAFLPEAV